MRKATCMWSALFGILERGFKCALRDAAGLTAQGHAEGVGRAGEECGHSGEIERSRAQPEVVVEELPEFAANLERMTATEATQNVGGNKGRIAAAGREVGRATEVEAAAGNVDLGESDGLGDAVTYPEVGGIEPGVGRAGTREPIESEARLIQKM